MLGPAVPELRRRGERARVQVHVHYAALHAHDMAERLVPLAAGKQVGVDDKAGYSVRAGIDDHAPHLAQAAAGAHHLRADADAGVIGGSARAVWYDRIESAGAMTPKTELPDAPPPKASRRVWLRHARRWVAAVRHGFRRHRRWLGALALGFALGAVAMLVLQVALSARPIGDSAPSPADPNPDVRVTLSPGLLTALIQQSIARGESPVPLENVRVETGNNRVTVRGDVSVLGRNVGGYVEMEPVVEDNQLRMRVRRSQLGIVPVPSNLERLAEGPINARLAATLSDLPATITQAHADRQGLTVTARVRTADLPGLSR